MIHQVDASPNDILKLNDLVDLQMRCLEFAAGQTSVDASAKADFEAFMQSSHRDKAKAVALWVFNKPKLVAQLNVFAQGCDRTCKTDFVEKMRADIALLHEPKAGLFEAVVEKNPPGWKEGAKKFCLYFYDAWGAGFDEYLLPNARGTKAAYSRSEFLENFVSKNNGLYICAICDAIGYRTHLNEHGYVSIEHFFPKATYPHLCLHPHNLIPICSQCNSIKNDDDLMGLCSSADGIAQLILPYRRDQHPGIRDCAYVNFTLRDGQGQRENIYPLELKIQAAANQQHDPQWLTTAISHFDQVYCVQERWNNALELVGEQTYRRIQQFLTLDLQVGNQLNDAGALKKRLEMLMAITSTENVGRDPFAFLTVWMLNYLVNTINQEGANAEVFTSLQCWAEKYTDVWKLMEDHVKELRLRLPV